MQVQTRPSISISHEGVKSPELVRASDDDPSTYTAFGEVNEFWHPLCIAHATDYCTLGHHCGLYIVRERPKGGKHGTFTAENLSMTLFSQIW